MVSGTDIGSQDFLDAVWKGGELYIDDDEIFKRALGGEKYKNRWLLKPSVLKNLVGYTKANGQATNDLSSEKTQMLGGTMVFSAKGELLHEYHESSSFDNGSGQALLEVVQGKTPATTPTQAEACASSSSSSEACSADACSK